MILGWFSEHALPPFLTIEDNAKGVFLLKVRLKKRNENEGTFHPEVSNHESGSEKE
jgi:hypothetical protein